MLILGKYGIMDILMRVHILVEVFMIVFMFLFHTGGMNILVDDVAYVGSKEKKTVNFIYDKFTNSFFNCNPLVQSAYYPYVYKLLFATI